MYDGRFTSSGYSNVMSSLARSDGTSMSTGPGRPVLAMWNASRNVVVSSSVDCKR